MQHLLDGEEVGPLVHAQDVAQGGCVRTLVPPHVMELGAAQDAVLCSSPAHLRLTCLLAAAMSRL